MTEFLENPDVVRDDRAIWSLVRLLLRFPEDADSAKHDLCSLYFPEARPRTCRSDDPWCSPGSSGTPPSPSRSRRRGRCTGRAGSSGSPSTRAGTGHTAARTPPGSSGTGQ